MMVALSALLHQGPVVSAQSGYLEQVMVLPVSVPDGRDDLADRLTAGLRSAVRLTNGQRLSTPEEIASQLGRSSVRTVLSSVSELFEFSELGGTPFIIGGRAQILDDGRIEVSVMLFSREEKAVHAVESAIFSDEEAAVAGISALTFELTHPRNYSPADTAFFYSLILPGMGQLNQGEPLHAALSAGAVLAAILYGTTTPRPDQYRLNWDSYQAVPVWGTDVYRFMIYDTEVSEEEFYTRLTADRIRNMRAIDQRRMVENRRKRTGYLLAGAYILNLFDTLILTRRKVDTGSFFTRLELVPDLASPNIDPRLQVRLVVRFR